MINLISQEAKRLNIKFNPGKSKFIHFYRGRFKDGFVLINDKIMKYESDVTYLGVKLNYCLNDNTLINNIRNNITWNSINIKQHLTGCHPFSICTVLKAKCLNLYGCETIFLKNHEKLHPIETAWNKAIRNSFSLPWRTHTNIVSDLSDIPLLRFYMYKCHIRFLTAFSRCNPVTSFLFKRFEHDCLSFTGNNLASSTIFLNNFNNKQPNLNTPMITEILNCLYSCATVQGFTYSELCSILNVLCTC